MMWFCSQGPSSGDHGLPISLQHVVHRRLPNSNWHVFFQGHAE